MKSIADRVVETDDVTKDKQLPCVKIGAETGEKVSCESCAGKIQLKVFSCSEFGGCTIAKQADGRACCANCSSYVQKPIPENRDFTANALTPLSIRRYDATNLAPELPGERFNASVIRWHDRELLAWRHNRKGSSIKLTDMGTGETWPLDLQHTFAAYGREDPRCFTYDNELYVAFTGVGQGGSFGVMYAEIEERDGGFVVGRVYYPDYAARTQREKNWSFFSVDDRLCAIYSYNPFRVLSIHGSDAELFCETAWQSPWQAGEMRGGASPVWHAGEWWAFFHGMDPRDRQYTCGVMTFGDDFKPRRCTRWPIAVATNAGRPASERNLAIYCCGCVIDGDTDTVTLSFGLHNAWIELRKYKMADVESAMEAV